MTKARAGVLIGLFLGGAVSALSWAQQAQPGPEALSPLHPQRTVEGTVVTSLADPPIRRAKAGLPVRAKEIGAGKVGAGPAGIGRETVVLMHGLGRSPRSMNRLERGLEAEGYRVVNLAYASRRGTVEEISEHLHEELAHRGLDREPRVHFVTHSLGGIVVRQYLSGHRPANLGRVVMLGPPNGGSELVDLLGRLPVLRHHPGPARGQLGTGAASLPARLGPVNFELGVIAGTRSWNPLSLWVLPGPDDGVVSVARARVDGMTDFLTVPRTHTFMMRGSDVIEQAVAFLRTGRFARAKTATGGPGPA